jgi:hypothetical protein
MYSKVEIKKIHKIKIIINSKIILLRIFNLVLVLERKKVTINCKLQIVEKV